MNKFATIRDMIRTIKMWWLIRCLYNQCLHYEADDLGEHPAKNYVNENRFLVYAALSKTGATKEECLQCMSERLPCPGCDYEGFMKEIGSKYSVQVTEKMALYRELLRLAKKAGYIDGSNKIDKKTGECTSYTIHTTNKGSEFTGVADLIELLFRKYKLMWTLFLVPIVTFILGFYLG